MTQTKKKHTFWINEQGTIVQESGNLFSQEMIKDFSPRLLCPILNSIFDELIKLKFEDTPISIPAVNLSTASINGYFDYILSKDDQNLIVWVIKDKTESNNNKLIRLQPEMEQKLRNETKTFLDKGKNCDIKNISK